jgi:cysteinyl-tRNA synthetase
MALSLHNSLTRQIEPFRPAHPPKVTVYGCGPTVYNHVTIGNWSSFIFFDVLVRWLRASGYQVTYVENLTDIDDRILKAIATTGEDRAAFTRRWEQVFLDGMKALGCLPADHHPRASEHLDGMVAIIQALLDKGHAYRGKDRSIYFRIASFPTYGELANLSKQALQAGASGRVQSEDFEKADVSDFALWKAYVPEDGKVFWEPTFTIDGASSVVKGRPGWHIECSAMIRALLGDQIDLHLGGEDLVFPHHQNEIAQSEGATGKRPFVRTWLHRRFLVVDGAKMSKSKGNFYTLADLVEKFGPSAPRGFRYLAATAHYRKPIDFTLPSLEAALQTLRNLDDAWARLAEHARGAKAPSGFAKPAEAAFRAAMDNDLETSGAMAAVHDAVHAANKGLTSGSLSAEDAAAVRDLLTLADGVLGLGLGASRGREPTAEQKRLIDRRAAAREQKQWAEADRLRQELKAVGIEVKDGKGGQTWSHL